MVRRKKRDYRSEYRRRLALAKAKGLSKSQARGHRRAGEARAKLTAREKALEDHKLQIALRTLRREKSITKAAKDGHIAPEKLRQVAVEKGILVRRGRRWIVRSDIERRILIYSGGKEYTITVATFDMASLIGKYMAAVRRFVRTNDAKQLKPFAGKSVKDIKAKRRYRLETRPNVLHQLVRSGDSFEQVYRIVI